MNDKAFRKNVNLLAINIKLSTLTDNVFPEPVCAIPITFLPDNVTGHVIA